MKSALTTAKHLWSRPNVKLTICVLGLVIAVSVLAAVTPLPNKNSDSQKPGFHAFGSASSLSLAKSQARVQDNQTAAAQSGTTLTQASYSAVQGSAQPLPNVPPQNNNSPDVPPISNPTLTLPKNMFTCIEPLMPIDACNLKCPESFISCSPCGPFLYRETPIACE